MPGRGTTHKESRFLNCDKVGDYLSSTLAPAASSSALAFSASSLEAPSRMGAGALSTSFLASASPSPLAMPRTALMTAIFCPPASVRTTSNSVFSSAASAAAAGAAAAAAGAAADTPHSSSRDLTSSAASSTVSLPYSSAIFLMSDILFFLLVGIVAPRASGHFSSYA